MSRSGRKKRKCRNTDSCKMMCITACPKPVLTSSMPPPVLNQSSSFVLAMQSSKVGTTPSCQRSTMVRCSIFVLSAFTSSSSRQSWKLILSDAKSDVPLATKYTEMTKYLCLSLTQNSKKYMSRI